MATTRPLRTRIVPAKRALPRLAAASTAIVLEMIFIGSIAAFTQVWRGYGIGLVGCAIATGLLGISLLFGTPSRRVARSGIALCVTLIVVWAIVRFGGGLVWEGFEPWPIGPRDWFVLGFLVILAGLLAPDAGWRRPAPNNPAIVTTRDARRY